MDKVGSQCCFTSVLEDFVYSPLLPSSTYLNVNLSLPFKLKSGHYYGGPNRPRGLKNCSILLIRTFKVFIYDMVS